MSNKEISYAVELQDFVKAVCNYIDQQLNLNAQTKAILLDMEKRLFELEKERDEITILPKGLKQH